AKPAPIARNKPVRYTDATAASEALQLLHHATTARYQREPTRNRIRVRSAPYQRRRAHDELRRSLARRSQLRSGDAGAGSARRHRLRPSRLASVLLAVDVVRTAVPHGVHAGHEPDDHQPDVLGPARATSRDSFRLLARRRHDSD